jgi:hypothetical protein
MSEPLATLLADLDAVAQLDAKARQACAERTGWLRTASNREIRECLQQLLRRSPPHSPPQEAWLAAAFLQLFLRQHRTPQHPQVPDTDDETCELVTKLYRHLGPACQARDRLLAWLVASQIPAGFTGLANLLAEDPPADATVVATLLSPFFQRRNYDPNLLFPRLLDGLVHPSAAATVLDLANFVTREELTPRHPAADRVGTLASLLGGIVGRLGGLESATAGADMSAAALAGQVQEGIALAVSLCDALAQIGDNSVVGKLYQTLDLSHRRVRAEAAHALARLGEQPGADTLVALAAEPVVRLRVLAYAEELGILDKIEAAYRTEQARAEAELALWLAQPSQLGYSPTSCELIDTRLIYWPGYDEPIQCSLFRFTYQFVDRGLSNIGLTGPLVHAFAADLLDLPPDDLYAAFAGWQAEHAEIYEIELDRLDEVQRSEVFRLERRLRDEGYEAVEPLKLGHFFGAKVLVARVLRQGQPGAAVVGPDQAYWLPQSASRRPLGPDEAYWIYKGRRLLRAFNP